MRVGRNGSGEGKEREGKDQVQGRENENSSGGNAPFPDIWRGPWAGNWVTVGSSKGIWDLGSCKENSMSVGCCVPGCGLGSRSVSGGGGRGPLTHAIFER